MGYLFISVMLKLTTRKLNIITGHATLIFLSCLDDLIIVHMTYNLVCDRKQFTNCFEQPFKWCKANGMVINTSKTKLMLITTHQRRAFLDTDNLFLTLNHAKLSTQEKDKILGVIVDNNLSWSSHIDQLCK
ncbi:MAG: hypothetical protein AB2693_21485, partial [Candidatus Thiodiazotropha sp.]